MNEIEKNPESKELFERESIEGTPFKVIHDTEKDEYFGIFGNYLITQNFKTKEEVINKLTPVTYDNIIVMVSVIFDTLTKSILTKE